MRYQEISSASPLTRAAACLADRASLGISDCYRIDTVGARRAQTATCSVICVRLQDLPIIVGDRSNSVLTVVLKRGYGVVLFCVLAERALAVGGIRERDANIR